MPRSSKKERDKIKYTIGANVSYNERKKILAALKMIRPDSVGGAARQVLLAWENGELKPSRKASLGLQEYYEKNCMTPVKI